MKQSMLYPRTTPARQAVCLDGMWRFQFDPKSEGVDAGWSGGLPDSISMPVPSSFCDIFTDKYSREYTGDFWYETDFFVPGTWHGSEVDIRFGSATHVARIFVNGVEIAQHTGGFLPFSARVTEIVRYNQRNKLSVLLNNELSETMLPCGTTAALPDGTKVSQPYFDFYNYAGIHRPVTLLCLPKEQIVDFTVNHRLNGADAEVDYTVETNGDNGVVVEVYDAKGSKVAESGGKTGTLHLQNPHLWGVYDGYLYTFIVRIMDGTRIVDEWFDKIGIRTFAVENGRFMLNGKPVYLRGFGKHEDADIRGRGLDLPTAKRDFECMKWIGANCFRTSHYPYAEEIYQMADDYGILVIDETPAVGLMESTMNFIEAATGPAGKKLGFFEKETIPTLLEHHKQVLVDMITRDKNHACVIAWSILNEPQCTSDGADDYFKPLFDLAHEVDVQKRPRTYAIVMMSLPHNCKCQHLCDFLSLNRYYGWYVMGGYGIANAEVAFRKEMDGWAAVMKGRPMIFTEYGADTMPSEHKLPSVMWSQEYQSEYLDMNHSVFDSYDFVQGELVWNFADFQTTEGIMRVNGNKKGIFTRQRQPKDAAFTFRARWTSLPLGYKSE